MHTRKEVAAGLLYLPVATYMAISVAVPKNLSGIKTKVAMNLTKRQLICFGGAGAVGIPFYLFTKGVLGTQVSALIMVAIMMPLPHPLSRRVRPRVRPTVAVALTVS